MNTSIDTLAYILQRFQLNTDQRMPVEIRDFDRESLAYLFRDLGFKTGVEVGVRDGGYSETMMIANPEMAALYGVDPYEPHKGYRDHTRKATFEGFEKEAHEKLDKYPNYIFLRQYSAEAVLDFADNSLDFVYIDGDHSFYEATFDIEKWYPKIRSGGIISGDDYFKHKGPSRIHVYQVVNGYTDAWKISPWFVLGTKEIVPGEKRDHGRSWMWVKP